MQKQVDLELRLFHIIIAVLNESEEVDSARIIKDIASVLRYDNPEKPFRP